MQTRMETGAVRGQENARQLRSLRYKTRFDDLSKYTVKLVGCIRIAVSHSEEMRSANVKVIQSQFKASLEKDPLALTLSIAT